MTLSDTTKTDPEISASVIMAESKEDILADNRPQSYIQGAKLHLITAAYVIETICIDDTFF